MIIGISGKKQHGKDTIGEIIEYLTNEYYHHGQIFNTYEGYLNMRAKLNPTRHWQKKAFAAKVKEIVCLLIGCTMQQLENNDFKEKPLGEEWDIPLGGTTRFLDKTCEYYRDNIAYRRMTPRKLLQLVGTDCGREIIHPNIWVNATMADYTPVPHITPNNLDLTYLANTYPNWIITDCRFPNEVKAIKDKGGVVIRVERFGMPEGDKHLSETALDGYKDFDCFINNNSDIDGLIDQVAIYLKHIKIIS